MEQQFFPSLSFIDGKTSSYGSKGILRHYHYWSDPNQVQELLQSEEFHSVSVLAHLCYLFLGIKKS